MQFFGGKRPRGLLIAKPLCQAAVGGLVWRACRSLGAVTPECGGRSAAGHSARAAASGVSNGASAMAAAYPGPRLCRTDAELMQEAMRRARYRVTFRSTSQHALSAGDDRATSKRPTSLACRAPASPRQLLKPADAEPSGQDRVCPQCRPRGSRDALVRRNAALMQGATAPGPVPQ